MADLEFIINEDGTAEHIESQEATRLSAHLGEVEIRRASDVEFDRQAGGWVIRFRDWVGIPDPPNVFPADKHCEAIALEVELLRQHYFKLAPITGNSLAGVVT